MIDGGNYLVLYLDCLLDRHLYFYSSMQENVPEKFKGIGIRIEDDVLVEKNQPKVLSSAIKELDDIQQLMAS